MVFGMVGERSAGVSKMVLEYFQVFEYNHGHDQGQKNSSTTMHKIAKIRSQPAKYNVFAELKLAISLAVLSTTESLKIAIITLIVPYLSLSITMDREKIIMLFSYHNAMEMVLKLEEWEMFTP